MCQWECELRHSFYNLTICIKCTINFMSFRLLITLVIYPKEMIRDTQRVFYNKDVNPSSIYKIWKLQKCQTMGLPWWRSGWESACQCRGRGFEPWSGRIPRVAEQLGPWATTTEPVRLEPVFRNKRGRDSERPAHCDEEWPPLAATRETPRTETKTQHSHKNK